MFGRCESSRLVGHDDDADDDDGDGTDSAPVDERDCCYANTLSHEGNRYMQDNPIVLLL